MSSQEKKDILVWPDSYTVAHRIGTAPNGASVYKATSKANGTVFAAVQLSADVFFSQKSNYLIMAAMVDTRFRHMKLLAISYIFKHEGSIWLLMPLFPLQSLRYLMASNEPFRHGLPEDCIAVAIREIIYGLGMVQRYDAHKKITAGEIFFDLDDHLIKLAYGGCSFDRQIELDAMPASESGKLSIWSVHEWGAPPEVYNSDNNSEALTLKSDTWFIGICALELAYGRLEFREREELLSMIKWIRINRRLPNKGETINFGEVKNVKENNKKKLNILKEIWKVIGTRQVNIGSLMAKLQNKEYGIKEYDEEKEKGKKAMKIKIPIPECLKKKEEKVRKLNCFSKEFGEMVADCLAENPKMRPSAWKLMHNKFFKNARSIAYFEDVVIKKEREPVWLY